MALTFLPPPRGAVGTLPSRRSKRKTKPPPELAVGQSVRMLNSTATAGLIDRTAEAAKAAWNRGPAERFPDRLDPSLWYSEGTSTNQFLFGAYRGPLQLEERTLTTSFSGGPGSDSSSDFAIEELTVPPRPDVEKRVQKLLGQRKIREAAEIVREESAPARCGNMVLDALSKANMLSEAEKTFDAISDRDVASYTIIMSVCGRLRKTDAAMKHFNRMLEEGVRPNAFAYSVLVEALGKMGLANDAEALFRKMGANGISPNVVAYNALMKAYVKAGRLRQALKLESEMRTKGTRPDIVTYGTLINACSKLREVDRAFSYFARMREEGIEPNRVLQEMRKNQIKPDLYAFNTLIDACGRARMSDRAFDCYYNLLESGLQPDTVTFNALISACGRSRDINGAFKALNLMIDEFGYSPDLHTYNTLIDACSKAKDASRAMEVYRRLKAENVQPCAVTYNALIDAWGRAGRTDMAMKLLQNLEEDAVVPDCYTLNTLVHAFCRVGDMSRAFELISYFETKFRVVPDQVTYNTIIEALKKAERYDEAWDMFDEMIQSGLQPTKVSYNSMACGCLRALDPHGATKLFETYLVYGADIELDVTTYSAIIECCTRGGQLRSAVDVFYKMNSEMVQKLTHLGRSLVTELRRHGDDVTADNLSWQFSSPARA
ncbi:hypothetical protein NDN08_006839 [Rhodosorus marinus]|uniref:PROP1-like PPR domain-containing protein n=1 Tax=Rhodosorus marinus TaxID=101924 RepID=A0AAV8UIV2_9RHOD|nr:hypothetical protein NDN08_006839 [Rhodosorus marinus]